MTIFCITGFSAKSTQLTEQVLLTCGMAHHLPLERDKTFDLIKWHERVIASLQQPQQSQSETGESAKQPSRVWQQLAIDLVVANMDAPHWGWAHPGAVQLLDFWAQLESDIRFVLVCEDRQSLICRLIEQGEAPESMPGHLALWAQSHQDMLRFHLRNPARSHLVWGAEVKIQPRKLVQQLATDWQTPLDATLLADQAVDSPSALLQHIALQILGEHTQTNALDHELQSVIGPSPFNADSKQVKTSDLIDVFLQLKERDNLQVQLSLAQQSSAEAHALIAHERLQFQADQEISLAQWQEQLLKVQEKVNLEATAKQDVLARNKDLQEESELLLSQLHQVQEELEKYFLENQKTQEKFKQETAAKQAALNKLAAEQKTIAELKKQRDEQATAKQDALAKNKDLQEESDLLLSQLHQVQEELENYYLKHQERQMEVQKLQARWLRAVQAYPELQDFEVLELLSESGTELTARWRINQLKVNGVMQGPFEFETLIENGVAGLVFEKDAKGHSPVHRWPLITAQENQLTILPVKGKDDPQKRSATILQLGTTDWQLVEQLSDTLVKALGSPSMAKTLGHWEALLEGLKAQRQILDKVPALLRFDDIHLFGQQNTEVKSVIGLRLTHADLQGLKANPFEFQLQLNLAPDAGNSTMASAHLIFDEKTAGKPFENWSNNVKSSAGQAVMALQLGPNGWSPQLWHQLSPLDQQWLQNTIRLLPFMLASLQHQGVKLQKGWATWGQAATELITWSKLPVGLPEAMSTATATNTTPDKLLPPEVAPARTKALRKPRSSTAKPAPTVQVKQASKATKQAARAAKSAPDASKSPLAKTPKTKAKAEAAKPVARKATRRAR